MKKRRVICFGMILMFGCLVVGCKKEETEIKDRTQAEVQEIVNNVEENINEDITETPDNQNLLTGLVDLSDEAVGKRPVAVMVNNVKDAMPQYGVEQADIIFEIPVESDLTRFMALYGDYTKVPQICAVRSCRYYFPALSEGFDAFYVHWGCDPTIDAYLASLNLDSYDGMANPGNLFGRDQERLNSGYSLEHTGYFDGTQFATYVQSQGTRTDLEEGKTGTAFLFNDIDESLKPIGDECTHIDINFGNQTASFAYDEVDNTYKKTNNGEIQIDGKTKNQLAFTNVFILETTVSIRDEIGRKEINITGGDDFTGYYISNGVMQKICWSKENESSRLMFFDENGKKLSINRGKSYIAFNYIDKTTFN